MTNLEELKNQFEKEDAFWQSKMTSYKEAVEAALKGAETFENDIKRWAVYIDIAADYNYRMMKLDEKHKKFLLRWKRRFRRAALIHCIEYYIGNYIFKET